MSNFAFVQPIIAFESPSVDVKLIVRRLYEFWNKELDNTTMVNGHQVRLIHQDEVIAPELNKLLQEGITNSVKEYVDALNINQEEEFFTSIHISNVWANVAEPGSYHRTHIHGNSHLNGIFYLQVPEESGETFIVNPYPTGLETIMKTPNSSVSLSAKSGLGYLFSSALPHYTDVNRSDADRISIVFEVKLDTIRRS